MTFREQVLYESESDCFLRFALDEWEPQGVKTIINLFQTEK